MAVQFSLLKCYFKGLVWGDGLEVNNTGNENKRILWNSNKQGNPKILISFKFHQFLAISKEENKLTRPFYKHQL